MFNIGVGVTAETGFYTRGDNRTVHAPDYAFIRRGKIPADGQLDITPDLVVEVISHMTAPET